MLTNNFNNDICYQISPNNNSWGVKYRLYDGTLNDNAKGYAMASLRNFGTANLDSNTQRSRIILGVGTTPTQATDYCLADEVSRTDYSLTSASLGSTSADYDNKCTFTTTCQWNGSDGTEISEVGILGNFSHLPLLFAREVLSTPIIVNNGDIFTVSIAIG